LAALFSFRAEKLLIQRTASPLRAIRHTPRAGGVPEPNQVAALVDLDRPKAIMATMWPDCYCQDATLSQLLLV
jgi:hypothetical protein